MNPTPQSLIQWAWMNKGWVVTLIAAIIEGASSLIKPIMDFIRRDSQPALAITSSPETRAILKSPVSSTITGTFNKSPVIVGHNNHYVEIVHNHGHGRSIAPFELRATTPGAVEIIDSIHRANPYDKAHTKQKYQRLNVTWRLALKSIEPCKDHDVVLGWAYDDTDERDALVCFQVSPLPAEFKSAPSDQLFWLRGSISVVNELCIYLELNPQVHFVSEPSS